jgi:SAM-dependent methyltransferase
MASISSVCRVCGGELSELVQRGANVRYEPTSFSPTYHRLGGHGDFYRCDCGAVQQPSLPRGSELHDLYREMSDDRYLREEEGRRRMARRLLDLLAEHVSGGRMLEVGCGYGLLLDEARLRGYEVEGVELAADAVRYAHERFGLSLRGMALEDATLDAAASGERYDSVLAVDVLEHLDDPVLALERLSALLAPGGVLLITSPDPSALVARLAGSHWWCYEPAHACLIPRDTLRGLIEAQGLALVQDTTSAQSFTLGYWLACLSERSGRAERAIARATKRLPQAMMLTASLHDERVLIARNVETAAHERRRIPPTVRKAAEEFLDRDTDHR